MCVCVCDSNLSKTGDFGKSLKEIWYIKIIAVELNVDAAAGSIKNTADIKDSLPRLLSGTFCFVSRFLPDFMLEEIEELTLELRSFTQGGHCDGGNLHSKQRPCPCIKGSCIPYSQTDCEPCLYMAGRNGQQCAQPQNGCALLCLDHIEICHVARVMSRVSCPSQTCVHPAPSCASFLNSICADAIS